MSTGAAARPPVPTWLVTGSRVHDREQAIAAHCQAGLPTVVILEGLADGTTALAAASAAGGTVGAVEDSILQVLRIAPGCLHCSGNLILRVTLNRVLRRPPARLYISLASAEHLEALRDWLSAAPYGALLALQEDLVLASAA